MTLNTTYESRLPLPDIDALTQALRAYASAKIVEGPNGFEAVVTYDEDDPFDLAEAWVNTRDEIRSLTHEVLPRPEKVVTNEEDV